MPELTPINIVAFLKSFFYLYEKQLFPMGLKFDPVNSQLEVPEDS